MTQTDNKTKIVKADGKSVVMVIEDINNLDFFFPIDGSLLQDVQPANKETHKWTLIEIFEKCGNNYELWDEPDEGIYIYDASSAEINPMCKTGMTKAELTGNVLYVGSLDHIELEVLYNSYSCRHMRKNMLMSEQDYIFAVEEIGGELVISPKILEPINKKYTPEELTKLCGGSKYIGTHLPVIVPGVVKMMVHTETADEENDFLNTPASVVARKAIYGPAAMISIKHLDNII